MIEVMWTISHRFESLLPFFKLCTAFVAHMLCDLYLFWQCDVYGSLFGLLTAHPVAPLVSLHHIEIVDPLFPYMGRLESLQHLEAPMKLDSEALMQQSICYDRSRNWTISVSWGYAVQIIRGFVTPRDMQRATRTFLNWHKRDEPTGFSFNTRSFSKHPCQKPYIYYLSNVLLNSNANVTVSDYVHQRMPHPWCWWKVENPEKIHRVEVYKKLNPHKWDQVNFDFFIYDFHFTFVFWYVSILK